MTCLIIAGPIPSMFICDSGSFSGRDGIIMPNSLSSALPASGASGAAQGVQPPEGEEHRHLSPIASAPFAMMNAASTLSMSPENTTNDT